MKVFKKLLAGIKNIFSSEHPRKKQAYAILTGKYVGQFFIYMEEVAGFYHFLSLPEMEVIAVPIDKFELGIKHNIIDPVDSLPTDIFSVCELQYRKACKPK